MWDYKIEVKEREPYEPDILEFEFFTATNYRYGRRKYYLTDGAVIFCGEAACMEVKLLGDGYYTVLQELIEALLWEVTTGQNFTLNIITNSKYLAHEVEEKLERLKPHLV